MRFDFQFRVPGAHARWPADAGRAVDQVLHAGFRGDIRHPFPLANLGFQTVVLLDAIAAVNRHPGDAQAAIGRMSEAGCILGHCHGTLP